jgi:integrase/recombinase XerD
MTRLRRPRIGKGGRPPRPLASGPPDSLLAQLARYLSWLAARGYAASTIKSQRNDLEKLCCFCSERGVTYPEELSHAVIDIFQRHVAHATKADGAPLDLHTQALKLHAVGSFCAWLTREGLCSSNPAAALTLPRRGLRLPKAVLTAEEVEKVLAVPDVRTPLGVRDRAMLETLYSTGVRRAELCDLVLADLDAERGVIAVRQGKGRKDRFVPIGARALAWVARYLAEVRPRQAHADDDGFLFLTIDGDPIAYGTLGAIVSTIIDKAGIGKRASCHIFRHTMATLMLEGGADVRFIQAILGHASLATTQVYTHVSIHALKAVHEATHPGATLRRREAGERPTGDRGRETGVEASQDAENTADSALLSLLDAKD